MQQYRPCDAYSHSAFYVIFMLLSFNAMMNLKFIVLISVETDWPGSSGVPREGAKGAPCPGPQGLKGPFNPLHAFLPFIGK